MRKTLTLFFMLVCVFAFAQTRNITGQVTDENGNPVPFASVAIKGTNKGTSADANGNFTIAVQTGNVLVFSSTGRTTKEVSVSTSNVINAALQPSTTVALSEVIVSSGYNTRRTQRSTVSN